MLNYPDSQWPMLMLLLLLVTGEGSAQQQPSMNAPPPAAAPAVLPEALAALEKMGGFLRSVQAFTLRADTSTDEVLADSGQKIQFNSVVEYRVRPPDRLRADVVSDRKHQQFFYDGKTLTLYGQRVHYYASIPAPPTIRETLIVAAQKYGLEVPLADLSFWGTDQDHPEDITAAINVGPSWIGGVLCDHYAFRQEGVDWQIWIERSDTPLPRKLVITTTEEAQQPQYIAVLTWNLTPQLDDAQFTFVPPAEARRIVMQEGALQPQPKN